MLLELRDITHSYGPGRAGQAESAHTHPPHTHTSHTQAPHTHGAGLYTVRPGNLLEGFSMGIEEGERVALRGHNGSGKTTLMHIIMGLIVPSASGLLMAFGRPCDTPEALSAMRRRVGFLFQDSDDQLFCPTVEEDVAFGPLNLGLTHEEARERVKQTLEALGIGHLRKCITHKLSGGEKRLVAFATIASMRPELYILDEPLTGLDREARGLMASYVRQHVSSALITSHDEEFLDEVTTRSVSL